MMKYFIPVLTAIHIFEEVFWCTDTYTSSRTHQPIRITGIIR